MPWHNSRDVILWQHGEGNVGDDDPGGHNYGRHLLAVVRTFRQYGVSAPFVVALVCLTGDPAPTRENVRAGQRGAVCAEIGIF